MRIRKQYLQLFWVASICLGYIFCPGDVAAQMRLVKNDTFWHTKNGQPIYSQGGGIFRFKDSVSGKLKYYWYGVHYAEAEKYLKDPSVTQSTSTFEAVTCYSSFDLCSWKSEGTVLDRAALKREKPTWVGRLGVVFVKQLNLYAMLVQHGRYLLITTAHSPKGPFQWYRQLDMTSLIGTSNTGDQTVFTDDQTGKSYLIYSYGRGRNKIYVSEIGVKDGKIDLLDCTQIYKGVGREGNCLFKYKNKYYMCASNLYGWDGSYPYYLVADDIRGPYNPANDMLVMNGATEDYAHVAQTGFFVTIQGSEQETVIFCGDRWADFAGNGLGYNQWCPLSFDQSVPYFNSLSAWKLNVTTGKWEVARDNNYVKNGSFEADRRRIPSPVKPIQEHLLGWETKVLLGNPISVDDPASPTLNHFNDRADRKDVIGEKSLNISDTRPFRRKVYQLICSSKNVKLEDGNYRLSAKIKCSDGFSRFVMYGKSGGHRFSHTIKATGNSWKLVELKHVLVKNGQIEVAFDATGEQGAFCYIDDVILKRE